MLFTLLELANSEGLSVETVAHYDILGLIEPVSQNDVPRYGTEARLRLKLIIKGLQLGLTLTDIKTLIDERVASKVELEIASDGRAKENKREDK